MEDPKYLGNIAMALLQEGKFKDAISEFNDAIKLDPSNGTFHSFKGIALSEYGKTSDGTVETKLAVNIDPENLEFRYNNARALVNARKFKEGLDECIKIESMNADYHNHHLQKGIALKQLGRSAEATEEFNKAIELDQNHERRCLAFLNLEKYDEALKESKLELEENPSDPVSHSLFGYVVLKGGAGGILDAEKAIGELDIALALSSDYLEPHLYKASYFMRSRSSDFKEALEELEKALSIDHTNVKCHLIKSEILKRLGKDAEALTEIDYLISREPGFPGHYISRGNLLADKLDRRKEAIEAYSTAISLNPNDPAFHEAKATELIRIGEYNDAIKEIREEASLLNQKSGFGYDLKTNFVSMLMSKQLYQEALEVIDIPGPLDDPSSDSMLASRVEVLTKMKRNQEALDTVNKMLSKDSPYIDALWQAVNSVWEIGEFEVVIKMLDVGISYDPDNPEFADAYFNKGQALFNLKRYQESLKEYDTAIRLNPDSTECRYSKIGSLRKMQRYKDALNEVALILQKNPGDEQAIKIKSELESQLRSSENETSKTNGQNSSGRIQGGSDGRLSELDLAIQRDPDNPSLHAEKADKLARNGKFLDSLNEISRAIELDPSNIKYILIKADVLWYSGSRNESLILLDHAISEFSQNIEQTLEVYWKKGLYLQDSGRNQEALDTVRKALSLKPDEPVFHSFASQLLVSLGSLNEALKEADQAISIDSNNAFSHNSRGLTLIAMNRYSEALDSLNRAISIAPKFPYSHANKSKVLDITGNASEALDEINIAISLKPDEESYVELKNKLLKKMNSQQRSANSTTVSNNVGKPICRQCHREITMDETVFCPYCGCKDPLKKPDDEVLKCKNCGEKILIPGALFCQKCGTRIQS